MLSLKFTICIYFLCVFQIKIGLEIPICRGIHHPAPLIRIPAKDGPWMNVLITRSVPFHILGPVTDSPLTRITENFRLMTGVMMNFPLEMNSLNGGAMIISILDPLIILILTTGGTHLLMNFVGHTHLDPRFYHFPLIGRNLTRGGPLGHHCPSSISQRLRQCLLRRYLICREEMNDQAM
jgi:hypothetical protein